MISLFPPSPSTLAPGVFGSAGLLDLGTIPAADGAGLLVAHITAEVDGSDDVKRRPSDKAKLRRAVGAVTGGALRAWRKGKPVYRPRDSKAFTGELVAHRSFVSAVDGMIALGLLHTKTQSNSPFDWGDGTLSFSGLAARLWPSNRLLTLATEHGITPATITDDFDVEFSSTPPAVPTQVIEQRVLNEPRRGGRKAVKARRVLTTKRDDETAQRLSQEVLEANKFAAELQVEGCVPPRWKRVFGPSWLLGGRWYALGSSGHYQALSSAKRAAITIQGEATAEVDVSAAHLSIMLGLLGLPLPDGDPYTFTGLPRSVVKKWITATLGNGAPVGARWPQRALADQPDLADFDPRAVGATIKERYQFLHNPGRAVVGAARLDELEHLGTPKRLLTHRLMGIEADALTSALSYLRQVRGVLALPVHDSLIVPASRGALARETIELAFRQRAGVAVRTKMDAPLA